MTEHKKCCRCSSKTLTINDFGIDKHGDYLATCNNCREYDRQRKANNREAVNQQAREHYQEIREDKIKQSSKWRAENIDRLKEKIECACGGKFQFMQKTEHGRTQKHQKYILSLTRI